MHGERENVYIWKGGVCMQGEGGCVYLEGVGRGCVHIEGVECVHGEREGVCIWKGQACVHAWGEDVRIWKG